MNSLSLRVLFGQGFEGYSAYSVIVDDSCAPADLEAYLCEAGILPDPLEEITEGGRPVIFSLHFGSRTLNHNESIAMQGVTQDGAVVFTGQYLRGEAMMSEWGSRRLGSAERVRTCLEQSL